MQDFIRIPHYLEYLNYRLQDFKLKSETAKADYAAAKAEYEAKFFPRLFNWKFEDSHAGDTSWLTGSWNFHEDRIETLQCEINRVTYLAGTGNILVTVGDCISIYGFYNWCKENGIP